MLTSVHRTKFEAGPQEGYAAGFENKIAAFDCTLERHEHMVYFWREPVDLIGSAVASVELSNNDQEVTLVGRAVDDLTRKCIVKLHGKMSRFDSDPTAAPLVESLPTASQTPETPGTPATGLSGSECMSQSASPGHTAALPSCVKQLSCHQVNTLTLAVFELQHRCNKLALWHISGFLSNIFFYFEEAPEDIYLHIYVKELDPDMRLALPGRRGSFRTRGCLLVGRVFGQEIFIGKSEHESLKMWEKPLTICQPGAALTYVGFVGVDETGPCHHCHPESARCCVRLLMVFQVVRVESFRGSKY